ncbi:MAG: cobalt-zinc-cadmium resistance protein [Deltaproteobacteria bacterium]|nr:MAG: cobalt-zinc-cadmium resistance protein [Deltaproteobacteria bacterium]
MSVSKHSGAISWMAGNSVAANLLMLICLVGGLFMATKARQEVIPAFDQDRVTVSVFYPGAGPEAVERSVVLPIEEALTGMEGIDEIASLSNEGRGSVTATALRGTDLKQLSQDIQAEIDRISTFPDEIEAPRVKISTSKLRVISLALYGRANPSVLQETAEVIRDRMLQETPVTQVKIDGRRDNEIRIAISMETLRRYGLSMGDIASQVSAAAIELPGGGMDTRRGEILIRMKERRDVAAAFADIPIITADTGTPVLLRDLADGIEDTFEEARQYATFNGEPALMLAFYRVGNQKPIEIAEAVKAMLPDIRASLPDGLDIAIVRDLSDVFRQRAELLVKNGYIGLILVFLLLALFLDIRLAFWVSLGIPISFLGAFLIFPFTDFSINMVTLFAFIVTLGIVVDDAIVVGENIYFYREQGMRFIDAAAAGARSIAMPVTFSILTNVVAFMPLFFVSGFIGKFFQLIPVVVITVFLISLIESLFILPAHLGHQRPISPGSFMDRVTRPQRLFSRLFMKTVNAVYGPVLNWVIAWRYTVFFACTAVLMLTVGYIKSGIMGFTLSPTVEADYADATITLPYGAPDSRLQAVTGKLIRSAQELVNANGGTALSRGIYASYDENTSRIQVFLTPPEQRPMSTRDFVAAWRNHVGEISGVESLDFMADRGGPGSGKSLTIELSHRNIEKLNAAAQDLAHRLEIYPRLSDIDDGSADGKPQIDFKMRPAGQRLGLTAAGVARQLRDAYYGRKALTLIRGGNEVTVRLRLPESERSAEATLDRFMLRTPGGGEVELNQATTATLGRAYTRIQRRDGRRILQVTAHVNPPSQTPLIIQDIKAAILPDFLETYPGLTASFEGKQATIRESVSSLVQGLILALIVIYAVLAIPFRSYFQPLIIMIAIPFGIVGAVGGHLIMGYGLSVISLFGIVALSGVVVNDSLVFIETANRRRNEGLLPAAAIHAAGLNRFRPILLTTLTTFGGLAPMIFETSFQARFLIPMALSLGFGILFATVITLLLVPALYLILEDAGTAIRFIFKAAPAPVVTEKNRHI